MGTVTVDADQYGDLVAITDIAKVKSPIEIVSIGTERLSRQASISLDQINRDVIALGGTTVFASTITPTGAGIRTDIESDDVATALQLRRLKTKMKKSNLNPRDDGYYLMWAHPNVVYDLRNEANSVTGAFQSVNLYVESGHDDIIRGEVGRLEGFRIMEINNAPTFSSDVTVYRSIALGDMKGWGAGDLQTLQTYHVTPGGDHTDPLAQEELLGWKVSFGVAVLNNTFYFGLETAATDV